MFTQSIPNLIEPLFRLRVHINNIFRVCSQEGNFPCQHSRIPKRAKWIQLCTRFCDHPGRKQRKCRRERPLPYLEVNQRPQTGSVSSGKSNKGSDSLSDMICRHSKAKNRSLRVTAERLNITGLLLTLVPTSSCVRTMLPETALVGTSAS